MAKSKQAFICSSPGHKGNIMIVGLGTAPIHGSPEQVYKCHVGWLKSQGYVNCGPHEYRPPNGGPILVLNRPGRNGFRVSWTAKKTRYYTKGSDGIIL